MLACLTSSINWNQPVVVLLLCNDVANADYYLIPWSWAACFRCRAIQVWMTFICILNRWCTFKLTLTSDIANRIMKFSDFKLLYFKVNGRQIIQLETNFNNENCFVIKREQRKVWKEVISSRKCWIITIIFDDKGDTLKCVGGRRQNQLEVKQSSFFCQCHANYKQKLCFVWNHRREEILNYSENLCLSLLRLRDSSATLSLRMNLPAINSALYYKIAIINMSIEIRNDEWADGGGAEKWKLNG